VYAIKACTVENLDRNYKNRNIYILSDSQAAIKALDKHQITSKLVWDCHQSLKQLARHNRVQLIWVPGHEGIVGNETVDQLARTGSEHPFIGPEPACGISIAVAKKEVRDCTNRNHKKTLGIHNQTQRGKMTYIRALCLCPVCGTHSSAEACFSPSTLVSPCQPSFHECSILHEVC
jgi:hypothetical protein